MSQWSPEVRDLLAQAKREDPVGTEGQIDRVRAAIERRLAIRDEHIPALRGVDFSARRRRVGPVIHVGAAAAATWISVAAFAATGAVAGWVVTRWSPQLSNVAAVTVSAQSSRTRRTPVLTQTPSQLNPPLPATIAPQEKSGPESQASHLSGATDHATPSNAVNRHRLTVAQSTSRGASSDIAAGPPLEPSTLALPPEALAQAVPSTPLPVARPPVGPDLVTAKQIEVLGQAYEALRHQRGNSAGVLLGQSAPLFEGSPLEEEFRFLGVMASCSDLRSESARQYVESFRRHYPNSVFAARINDQCGGR